MSEQQNGQEIQSEQKENSYLKELLSVNEYYQAIYNILAPNQTDELIPPSIKLMKDFAFKDLLSSSAHFRCFTSLVQESIRLKNDLEKQNKEESEPKNYNVNITDTPVETSEKI